MNELNMTFNNKNSIVDYGIYLVEKPSIPIPEKRVTKFQVPGRDGELTVSDGSYEPIEIVVELNFTTDDFNKAVKDIKNWLLSDVNNHLRFSNIDGFYKVDRIVLSDVTRVDSTRSGKLKATFICDPFLFADNSDEVITINYSASNQVINNDGYKTYPYIKVYGTGTVTLTINGLPIVLTSVSSYVELDSELMDCYKDTVAKNNTMTGNFPILENGDNTILMSSSATKIEIIPRWRSL